jgi:phosphoglycerate kinase
MIDINKYDFSGKNALVRVDFNVPLDDDFNVTDDTRIRAALPTIKAIIEEGGTVILMSHLGRPKTGPEDKFSLRHIVGKLSELLGEPVHFVDDCVGQESVEETTSLPEGSVCLLENLRFYKEETAGDEFFAGQLAEHGDVYVNDAFGTAHRAHASTAIIAQFFHTDKMFGHLLSREIGSLNKVLKEPKKPVTAIIGGAKVSSKITILENLIDKCDNIIVGGGMAFTFLKAQGGKVGSSLVEDDQLGLALKILKAGEEAGTKICIPTDAIIADEFSNEAQIDEVASNEIPDGWMGLDIGRNSIEEFSNVIRNSKTVLWNGPMGVFEMENFEKGTKAIADVLDETTQKNGTFTLIGGGDSVAAINKFELADQVSYVSTGGGAMLEYLEGKVLPGIAAIQ